MALLVFVALSLLAWGAVRDRSGPLWRWLVLSPARWLSDLRPREVIALALLLVIAPPLAEMAMPGLAVVMAVDLAAWIEVTAAMLIVARVLPGWTLLKTTAARVAGKSAVLARGAVRRLAARTRRPAPARRPSSPSGLDDEGGGWAFA